MNPLNTNEEYVTSNQLRIGDEVRSAYTNYPSEFYDCPYTTITKLIDNGVTTKIYCKPKGSEIFCYSLEKPKNIIRKVKEVYDWTKCNEGEEIVKFKDVRIGDEVRTHKDVDYPQIRYGIRYSKVTGIAGSTMALACCSFTPAFTDVGSPTLIRKKVKMTAEELASKMGIDIYKKVKMTHSEIKEQIKLQLQNLHEVITHDKASGLGIKLYKTKEQLIEEILANI